MRRTILVSALMLVALFGMASAQETVKAVSIQFGPFIPADWKVQDTYSFGHNSGYLGPGDGFEIDGNLALIRNDWRFQIETGYRWQENASQKENYWYGDIKVDSKMNIIPLQFSISRRISTEASKSSIYIGSGAGVNFANFKITQTLYDFNRVEEATVKDNIISPGVFMLGGFDIPLSAKYFMQAEIRYSYYYSNWELWYTDAIAFKFDDLNIGGTALKFGIERRF